MNMAEEEVLDGLIYATAALLRRETNEEQNNGCELRWKFCKRSTTFSSTAVMTSSHSSFQPMNQTDTGGITLSPTTSTRGDLNDPQS